MSALNIAKHYNEDYVAAYIAIIGMTPAHFHVGIVYTPVLWCQHEIFGRNVPDKLRFKV